MKQHSKSNKEWTEISQFDIPDRQLTIGHEAKKEDNYTDIGEAQVVSTVFGKAKVRIIHKQKKSNLLWQLAALVVVIGIAALIVLKYLLPQPEPLPVVTRSTRTAVTEQPSLPTLQAAPNEPTKVSDVVSPQKKSEPEKIAPAEKPLKVSKPKSLPIDASNYQPKISDQAKHPVVHKQAVAKNVVEIKPASQMMATPPAVPLMNKVQPTAPVTELLPEKAIKIIAPVGIDLQSAPISTQP